MTAIVLYILTSLALAEHIPYTPPEQPSLVGTRAEIGFRRAISGPQTRRAIDFILAGSGATATPEGAIANQLYNLLGTITAIHNLRDAIGLYGRSVDYCGEILAHRRRFTDRSRRDAAVDLSICCTRLVSGCYSACQPPPMSAARAFISSLPAGNTAYDLANRFSSGIIPPGAQSLVDGRATLCVTCISNALESVANAEINERNQITRCGPR